MSKKIGTLRLLDVRTLWPSEARDFTPWLAKEENIERFGNALGIGLEVENTEVAVGLLASLRVRPHARKRAQ